MCLYAKLSTNVKWGYRNRDIFSCEMFCFRDLSQWAWMYLWNPPCSAAAAQSHSQKHRCMERGTEEERALWEADEVLSILSVNTRWNFPPWLKGREGELMLFSSPTLAIMLAHWLTPTHARAPFPIFFSCYRFSPWGSCCQFLPRLIIALLASPCNGPILSNPEHKGPCSAYD